MAIKFNIKALEDVEEGLRSQYKAVDAADPSKGFVLDVDGLPQQEDVGALKRALDHERSNAKEAIEKARREGNTAEMEALRKSYDGKVADLQKQIKDVELKARGSLHDKTVSELALELGGAKFAKVLEPHLRSRVSIESPDGTDIVRFLSPDGKASALSREDLKKEFETSEIFAPLIQGGRASGSGTPGGGSSSGGAGGSAGGSANPLPNNPTPADKVAWLRQQNVPGFKAQA